MECWCSSVLDAYINYDCYKRKSSLIINVRSTFRARYLKSSVQVILPSLQSPRLYGFSTETMKVAILDLKLSLIFRAASLLSAMAEAARSLLWNKSCKHAGYISHHDAKYQPLQSRWHDHHIIRKFGYGLGWCKIAIVSILAAGRGDRNALPRVHKSSWRVIWLI